MISLTAKLPSGSEYVLGKKVSELQNFGAIGTSGPGEFSISTNLNYISAWSLINNSVDKQSGNFFALQIESPNKNAKITTWVESGDAPVKIDGVSEQSVIYVYRVHDGSTGEAETTIHAKCTKGIESIENVYHCTFTCSTRDG